MMIFKYFIYCMLLIFTACSGEGDSSITEDKFIPSDPSLDGIVSTDLKAKFEKDGLPTSEYSLRLYNLDSYSFVDLETLPSGRVFGSVEDLSYGTSYSFAVVSESGRLIGFLDFSGSDGLQGAIVYDGGFGFDIGTIQITSQNGSEQLATEHLSIGGSFYIDTTQSGELNSTAVPEGLSDLLVGRQLIVTDSVDLYNLFVESDFGSDEYSYGLTKYSSIFIHPKYKNTPEYRNVNLARFYGWVTGASVEYDIFDQSEDRQLWSDTNFAIPLSNSDYGMSIFVNSDDLTGALLPLAFHLENGDQGPIVHRFLPESVQYPPLIRKIDRGGSENLTLEDINSHEGLLTLFNLDSAAYNPVIELSAFEAGKYQDIEVRLSYFDGVSEIDVDVSDLASPWGSNRTVQLSKTELQYTWNPLKQSISRVIDQSSEAPYFEIPSQLLTSGILSKPSDRVRIDVILKGRKYRAGSSYWVALRP